MFADLMQDHKVMREEDTCPNFLMEQISIFRHQIDIMEQETTKKNC